MKRDKRPAAAAAPSWLPTAVLVLTFAAFLPALFNNFVDWDDGVFIVKNPHIRSLFDLPWMLTSHMGGHYHPLTWLSFALDYAVWGLNPLGFHLTNVVLHALNAALFFYVAKRLLAAAQPELDARRAGFTAALAALLFGLHPLRVESVAWATERRDVLSGFFYLLAVLEYLKERRGRSLAFFACSLLSKAVGVTLPLVLLVLDRYPLKREKPLSDKAPYFALAAAALGANLLTEAGNIASVPLASRLWAAAYGLSFYAAKTVWPSHLVPIYEFPTSFTAPFAAVVVLAAAAALLALRKRRPELAASALFYALTLLPMLGLVSYGPQLVADRYSYLSCLPLALLAAAGAERLARRGAAETFALCAVVLAALGLLTWSQCGVWKDTDHFFAYVLAERPDTAIAHHNVGRRFEAQGLLGRAEEEYRRAVEIRPEYALAWNSLGLVLSREGRPKEGEPALRKALALKPDYWEALANLGLAYASEKRYDEARAELEKAVALQPGLPSLRRDLGLIENARRSR